MLIFVPTLNIELWECLFISIMTVQKTWAGLQQKFIFKMLKKKKKKEGEDEEEGRGLEGGREDWGWRIVSKRKVNKGSSQN